MSSIVIPITRNDPGELYLPSNTGSSIIACEFQGGVIIGADLRRTTGDYINNRTAEKLIKIDDFIYCCGSGSAAAIQSIIDSALYQLNVQKENFLGAGASVLTVATIFRNLCYCNKNHHNVEFAIVGCDNYKGEQIYVITSGGMMKRESVSALGSGGPYAYGCIDTHFQANMSKREAEAFVSKNVALAVARDSSSGGQFGLAVITKHEVERFVVHV